MNATNFYNTVWESHNLGTRFIRYLFLKSDGSIGYRESGSNFKYDGTDTWKLEKGFYDNLVEWFCDGEIRH